MVGRACAPWGVVGASIRDRAILNATRFILVGAVVLSLAAAARADLRALPFDASAPTVNLGAAPVSAEPSFVSDGVTTDRSGLLAADLYPDGVAGHDWDWDGGATTGPLFRDIPDASAELTSASPDRPEFTVPPLPGSASLFLGAMLSVGAWQVVRSTRNANLSFLPEWYHSGGPAQIGHAVPFDLDLNAITLCFFESVDGGLGQQSAFDYVRRELRSRLNAQCFLSIADPRGPPARS